MPRVPIHIPVHIRFHDRAGCPPDITVEPACVHASVRDTLDWDLQGGGRFALEVLDGQTPFGNAFRLVSDSDGCCSEMIGGYAEAGTYHYALDGKAASPAAGGESVGANPTVGIDPAADPRHFAIKGCLEIVVG